MGLLTWKNRIAPHQPKQTTEEVISNINRYLRQRVLNNEINDEQLIKIQNLAANPIELKKALTWL